MIIEAKCVDCGRLRLGQEEIKEPRCYDCIRKFFNKRIDSNFNTTKEQ